MRKITFAAFAFFFHILTSFSQTSSDTAYKSRKLKWEEINFVSGYYHQDGNHSAVTGGIGTEKLSDLSNTLDIKLVRTDKRSREHSLTAEIGIDHYTSASSDKIDPNTISSPSYSDTRIYPSVNYNIKNPANGFSFGGGLSFSNEFDYHSFGAALQLAKSSADNNTEINLKLQAYLDKWRVIYPIELRPPGYGTGSSEGRNSGSVDQAPRNSYSASLAFSRVINEKMQFALLLDLVTQNGHLETSYQRVYFNNNSAKPELLPDKRFKVPVGARFNWFLTNKVMLRTFYRYYYDDWGLTAHTLELELPIKITPFFSLSPFYRFYSQQAADYFAPYKEHLTTDQFFTSDYDLSKFTSDYLGASFRFVPSKGVFNVANWNTLELRYGHYKRNDGLNSNMVTLAAKFK
jgi:hypothetical protein